VGVDEERHLDHAWRLVVHLNQKYAPATIVVVGAFFVLTFAGMLDGPLSFLCVFFPSVIEKWLLLAHFVTFFTKKACSLPNGCAKKIFDFAGNKRDLDLRSKEE
jgi:hypothetical protein